jgi:hypothetical protein
VARNLAAYLPTLGVALRPRAAAAPHVCGRVLSLGAETWRWWGLLLVLSDCALVFGIGQLHGGSA